MAAIIIVLVGYLIRNYDLIRESYKFRDRITEVITNNLKAIEYEPSIIQLTSDESNDQYPVFSPNGEQIAYISAGRLYIIDRAGVSRRALSEKIFEKDAEVKGIKWSPDGGKIAVSYQNDLFILDVNTTNIVKVENIRDPDWSPQGDRIVGFDLTSRSICIINATGENKRTVLDMGQGAATSLAWTDGNKIYYLSWHKKEGNQDEISSGLFYSDIRMLDLVTKQVEVILHNGLRNSYLLLSPDYSKLLYNSATIYDFLISPLWVLTVDAENNESERLSKIAYGRAWSLDSSMILFQSLTPGGFGLYVMEINSRKMWYIKGLENDWTGGSWSPDGKSIVASIPQTDTNGDSRIDVSDNHNIVIVKLNLQQKKKVHNTTISGCSHS